MAFDFPSSPIENQSFTPPGGPTYIFKAPHWVSQNFTTGTVPEAPNDGQIYARQSLGWVVTYSKGALDGQLAAKAPIANPVFTGDPKAPTPLPGDNDTSIATTAFVTSAVAAGVSNKVNRTGDTMTGTLAIRPAAANVAFILDRQVGSGGAYIQGQVGGSARWLEYFGAGAESGANSGSNYYLYRYNDAGVAIDSPFYINRANGIGTFPLGLTAPTKIASDNSTNVATTAFVKANGGAPSGSILYFAGPTVPAGWIKCNGAALNRTTYAALFAAIGGYYGAGDGSTTFNVPDLRGEFLRGADEGRGADPGRAFASWQGQAYLSHAHGFTGAAMGAHAHSGSSGTQSANHTHTFADTSSATTSAGAHTHANTGARIPNTTAAWGFGSGNGVNFTDNKATNSAGAHTHTVAVSGTTAGNNVSHTHAVTINAAGAGTPAGTVAAAGGAETRPRNMAMFAIIKY